MFRKSDAPSFEDRVQPSRESVPFVAVRLWVLGILGFFALAGFGIRLYDLTVLRYPYYRELSENNYLFEQPMSAPRGKIMTADGASIALNRTTYDIEMGPYGMEPDAIVRTISRLADLMGRPELNKRAQAVIDLRPKWKRLPLARELDLQSITPVLERAYELPGVVIESQYSRLYPYGALTAHVTGYVGLIAEKQIEDYRREGYLDSDKVGRIGAERQFETMLRGTHGTELTIRDAHGRPRTSRIQTAATRGNDVVLTLDLALQTAADALLEGSKGVAIAMDPRDGSILALVSKLDYDPNNPLKGSKEETTSSFNSAVRGRFAPASTFKLVTAAAGLKAGRSPDEDYSCGGNYRLPNFNQPFWCDVRWGHGKLDLSGAIQKSCNVYFYHWADELGLDRLMETAREFGFGEPTGVDLLPEGREPRGTVGKGGGSVFRGSIIQMGIGQGALITVTPMQLVNAYAALANGGKRYRPHLFKEERSPIGQVLRRHEAEILGELKLAPEQRQILLEGFRRVVQEKGGTGYGVKFNPDWDVAGKTGSAEVHGQEKTNGWFVCVAPLSNPEICVVALIEGEGHGATTAGPIAKGILEAYFARHKPIQLAAGSSSLN